MSKKHTAFTLIELLIVVAIIAILAAIAVPNLLEAQTRAKVSRSMADIQTLATAVEIYRLDANYYPLPAAVMAANGSIQYPMPSPMHSMYSHNFLAGSLTSPIAYVTSLSADPFIRPAPEPQRENELYYYQNFEYTEKLVALNGGSMPPTMIQRYRAYGLWVMFACGPDRDRKDLAPARVGPAGDLVNAMYDPSNGTVSNGDIIRTQKRTDGPLI